VRDGFIGVGLIGVPGVRVIVILGAGLILTGGVDQARVLTRLLALPVVRALRRVIPGIPSWRFTLEGAVLKEAVVKEAVMKEAVVKETAP